MLNTQVQNSIDKPRKSALQRQRFSQPLSPNQRQQGVGLIEVMVAVVILSIGFLAAGRMQTQGVRAAQEAYVRSQAHFLVKDMVDRMRSNPAGVADGAYNGVDTKNTEYLQPDCASKSTTSQPCSAFEIAQYDLAVWAGYINSPDTDGVTPLLPSGPEVQANGSIEENAANGIYTVTVRWSLIVNGVEEEQSLSTEMVP